MSSMNVKKGDRVVVLAGKDKGKKGEVIAALPKDNRVIVQGMTLPNHHFCGAHNCAKLAQRRMLDLGETTLALFHGLNQQANRLEQT